MLLAGVAGLISPRSHWRPLMDKKISGLLGVAAAIVAVTGALAAPPNNLNWQSRLAIRTCSSPFAVGSR